MIHLLILYFCTTRFYAYAQESTIEFKTAFDQVSAHVLSSAQSDMERSFDWASAQINAVIPIGFDNSTRETPVGEIRQSLRQLGESVVKGLRPGLEQAVLKLLTKHQSDPELKNKPISGDEMALFVEDLSHFWTSAIQKALTEWMRNGLPKLLAFVGRLLQGMMH